MEKLADTINGLNENMTMAALEYLKLGYRPLVVHPGSKAAGVPWKTFQTESPSEAEIREWFADGEPNIALITGNGLVVVDVDAADQALLQEIIEHCGDTPMKSRTPSGGTHLFFRMRQGVHYGNSVRIKGKPIDLRCEGAYIICPWSRTEKGHYRWEGPVFPVAELPLVKIGWLRGRKPTHKMKPAEDLSPDMRLRELRAVAWLAHVEGAISGQNGHRQTMRVAGRLIQRFRLDFETAFRCMKKWNLTCEPEWSDAELIHKLESAVANIDKYPA